MKQPVDIVEDVFLCEDLARIGCVEMLQPGVGDAIADLVTGFGGRAGKEVAIFWGVLFLVEVKGETLGAVHCGHV